MMGSEGNSVISRRGVEEWQGVVRSGKEWWGVVRSGKEWWGVARSGKEWCEEWWGVVRSEWKGDNCIDACEDHEWKKGQPCTYQVEPSGGFDKSVPADSAGYAGTEFLVQDSQGHSPSGRIHMYTYMYDRNMLTDIQSQFSEYTVVSLSCRTEETA